MQGRTRNRKERYLHLENIKKGSEKFAADDFRESLKKMTGINVNSATANEISGLGKAAGKMSGDFINTQFREVKKDVMNSASNGERSNTLMNFVGVSKMGYTLLVNSGLNISNNENFAKAINKEPDSVFNSENMKKLNQTLLNNNVITPENKLKIDGNNAYKSLKDIDKKLNIYISDYNIHQQSRSHELSTSPKKMISKLAEARKDGNVDLANVLETKIGINELTKGKHATLKRPERIFGSARRMASMNIQDPVFQGINSLAYYKSVTKTLVKTSCIYYKGVGKGLIKSGDFALTGLAKVSGKVGIQPIENALMGTRNILANVGNGEYYKGTVNGIVKLGDMGLTGVSNSLSRYGFQRSSRVLSGTRNFIAKRGRPIRKFVLNPKRGTKNIKIGVRNTIHKLPGNAVHGASVVGSSTGRFIAKGAIATGNAVGRTSTYKAVAGTASKATFFLADSTFGRVTGRIGRAGGKLAVNTFRGGLKAGHYLALPFKFTEKGFVFLGKGILRGFNLVNLLLKKIILAVAGAAAAVVLLSVVVVLIIVAISTIGDAVSNSLEDFKTKTTMGATYDKLLAKEQEFNAAVMNLTDSIAVPEGYSDYAISKYTNVNVHYLGADGKEISWSGAMGDINVDPSVVTDAVWTYMKKKGWSNISIAGLLGNMQQESAFRVSCVENAGDNGSATVLGSGYGLCQWTNTQGNTHGRRYGLFQYAANHGGLPSDIDMQLGYLLYGEGSDSTLARKYGTMDFSSVAEATRYFCDKWERPNAAASNLSGVRIPAAQKFYDYYSNNPDFSDIESDGSGTEEDTSGDSDIIASGYSTANTTTIKGILSMAAVYIDQDFNKYGAFTDGVFADSVYKDYCAKLYDSSHIIGVDQTLPAVYHCPAFSATESEPEYPVASESCNNKIPGGGSENDWIGAGSGITRNVSLSITKSGDSYSYDCSSENCGGHEQTYDRYEIVESGPHGTVSYSTGDESGSGALAVAEIINRGCKKYKTFVASKDDESTEYIIACYCDECRGHIDANAYVFVANIYDPSIDVPKKDEHSDVTEGTGTETETTASDTSSDGDAFNHVDQTEKEYQYSLYALDKYATAFDSPDSGTKWVYCTNPECSHYSVPSADIGYADGTVSMAEITSDDPSCPECGTELNYPMTGRPGDQESCNTADATGNRAAEQYIMEDITGLPMQIVDWWKNEGWFTNLSTTKTYFRLPGFEDSIDTLEIPEPDENGDINVVNKGNSTPYWFNAFTSVSGRNMQFEKQGWNNDNITLVRLIMAADWTDLYGIKDFGYVQGAPMTPGQIAQIIANNPAWKDLPVWRQQIMAVCSSLPQGHPYVWSGKAASPGLPVKGLDCSGFTQWAYWTATGVKLGGSTGEQSQDNVSGGKLVKISPSELLPGDMGFKYIGGSVSQSNSNHVGIYAGMENGIPLWCHESGSKSGYKFKAPYPGFTQFYRISPNLVDDNEFTENSESEGD